MSDYICAHYYLTGLVYYTVTRTELVFQDVCLMAKM